MVSCWITAAVLVIAGWKISGFSRCRECKKWCRSELYYVKVCKECFRASERRRYESEFAINSWMAKEKHGQMIIDGVDRAWERASS
jgi:hypothetical protein